MTTKSTIETPTGESVFTTLESEVRSYCRNFPAVFTKARGHIIWDENGREYVDFFSGAGALNYGHNNPHLKERLIRYLTDDGITHSLDLYTQAKSEFLTQFYEVILAPRKMRYKTMFPGPTGTNAVESALKLARKITGRSNVISFSNAFHGMTLGSLSLTGNQFKRHGAGIPLTLGIHMPFDGYMGPGVDTTEYLSQFIDDNGSGVALPAAVILETLQGEGGINVASAQWLRKVERICKERDIILIVDDVQVGCGRTGPFFSFETAGISPDIVCLSKSIGGYGLPMAITLIKPELDQWEPGEHNGTFRGNNHAFVTAAAALDYWKDDALQQSTEQKGEHVREALEAIADRHPELGAEVRGKGLIQGLACDIPGAAEAFSRAAFANGLIIETSGAESQVLKVLPPLTIPDDGLEKGLQILSKTVDDVSKHLQKP